MMNVISSSLLCYVLVLYSTNPGLQAASEDVKGCLAPTQAAKAGTRQVTEATEFGTVAGAPSTIHGG